MQVVFITAMKKRSAIISSEGDRLYTRQTFGNKAGNIWI